MCARSGLAPVIHSTSASCCESHDCMCCSCSQVSFLYRGAVQLCHECQCHVNSRSGSTQIIKLQLRLRFLCCLVSLLFFAHLVSAYPNYQAYNALAGNSIALPCNITPPTTDDGVSLILWYRDDLSSPIYTVDARLVPHLHTAKHLFDATTLASRASFNITSPVSYLRFNPVIESDTAEYRCRVDFRRGRTINRVMKLNVIVPTKKVSIYDSNSNYVNDIAGPFNEDSSLNLTCESEGGLPLPVVKWWKGDALLTDNSSSPSKSIVRNVASFSPLLREHLMMPLTCEASNTNLTVPVTKTILVDLNLKPTEVRIIEPLGNMTAGQRVELVCQSSGSRPPAKITWRRNGKLVDHYSDSTSDDGSVTTSFITFVPSTEDNGKLLVCVAQNPQFSDFHIEDTLHLDVHYAPILSLLLGASVQRQEIVESSGVYFDCNVQANPQVHKLGWLFNGKELRQTEHDNNIEIRNNSIIINSVKKDHIGGYQCYAANPLGKSVSEVVNLNVKFSPTCVTTNELYYEAQSFEELALLCEVSAEPADVLFEWEFNSTSSYDKSTLRKEPLMSIANSGLKSELKFTPRSAQDFGTLYCYAQNRIGQQVKPCVFHIRKSEAPELPQNCSLANVTVTSLTVQCSAERQPRLSEQYALEIYNEANELIKNVSRDSPHFQVSDLPPGISFSLMVYAANKNGASEKVRINANTLVGEPRKLEHIEHKMNARPLLVLAVLVACLLAFTLIFLFLLLKLRNRYKTKHKSRKPCSVFDMASAIASTSETSAAPASEQANLSAYSQMKPPTCSAIDNLPADGGPIMELGTTNGAILNHLTSGPELMVHPYLELTNLDRLLKGGIIDQRQATDYPLVHSSKDHVAICSEANISSELMYLHASATDSAKTSSSSSFYPECLMQLDKDMNGSNMMQEQNVGGYLGTNSSLSKHVPTIPCIIVDHPDVLFCKTKSIDALYSLEGTFDQSPPHKSTPKVRFIE